MDGDVAYDTLRQKIHSGEVLEDDDLMKLVILPLTVPDPEEKQEMQEKIVELAEQITEKEQRIFTLSGVIVASDKFIKREYLDQIRRRINITQLGQLYEKEKIEYGKQKTREMALKMLKRNIDIMEVTGLTEDKLLRLQDKGVTV